MWIKNVAVYRSKESLEIESAAIEGKLKGREFSPCKGHEKEKLGWVPVLGGVFAHSINGAIILRVRKETRSVPSSVVQAELSKQVALMESKGATEVSKQQKNAMKEKIVSDLLPRAFPKQKDSYLLIYPEAGMVCVEAGSWNEGDSITALLRGTLESLPVAPAMPSTAIETTITQWVKKSFVGPGFRLLDEVEISSAIESGSTLRGVKQDLEDEKLIEHLKDGDKFVSRVTVEWRGSLSLMVCKDGLFRKLKWGDEIKDQNEDIPKADKVARLDADLALVSGEWSSFIDEVYPELGGF
ncbi:recombination-associated protein RdgC [Vibrio owensii]|uniref:recombination-associated protein RdgC n=1 Tax=Vibrio owensii TaxID=696485 RepID=UPI0018F17F17|nr:recombination-associated protein RdgC [Vibrio owensii]